MKVVVIGSGLMGNGISLACAQAGYNVTNIDTFPSAIEKAKTTTAKLYDKKVAKGKMTREEADAVVARIAYADSYQAAADADLVIEAVPEKIAIKKAVFAELAKACKKEAILVSNTSGLSISEIASVTDRPNQVMGVHFFYPAPVMSLLN